MTARPTASRLATGTTRRRAVGRLGVGLVLTLVVAACGSAGGSGGRTNQTQTPAPSPGRCRGHRLCEEGAGVRVPLPGARQPAGGSGDAGVLQPQAITNPLFPIAQVTQSLQLGTVDGEPFRAEVTLLPGTRTITWNGRQVPTRIHQYVAYSGGRILEVALDWYAQADDGSVWYFGEDVFNYQDGVVADTHGTWLAGKDGPPGMIMPANPSPGQVYRPENIPDLVFEQVTVKAAGRRVPGPRGTVDGAMVITELHMDGRTEDKTFAPATASSWPVAAASLRRSPWPSRSTRSAGPHRRSWPSWPAEPGPASTPPGPGAGRPPPRGSTPWQRRGGGFAGLTFPSCWPPR